MYNQPYFIPGYYASSMAPSMMRGAMLGSRGAIGNVALNGARLGTTGASKGLGLFSRLGSGLQAFKGINWGGLINNTSKTLNVVNQAIPLVRQVGPVFSNMKSMLRIASVFKDETDNRPIQNINRTSNLSSNYVYTNTTNNNTNSLEYKTTTDNREQNYYDDNSPTFFVDA